MLTLENNQLVIRFPEVHADAVCTIEFQRTLRIPDDNRVHKLPPGLGRFPLFHVEDHAAKVPASWSEHGGVFLPMYQAEAMWIRFSSKYPFAVKIAAGKINAVSGEPWSPALKPSVRMVKAAHDMLARPPVEQKAYMDSFIGQAEFPIKGEQDYVTIPDQPWLDGFNVGEGQIRQFVAMPLGDGYTVEEQITGEAIHGGLQLIVYPLKAEFYSPPRSALRSMGMAAMSLESTTFACASNAQPQMGLAPGGLMTQQIYADKRDFAQWDQSKSAKCFVHLLNSAVFEQVTGKKPPTQAPTAADYTAARLPWFDYYAEGKTALPGAANLKKLVSVAAMGHKKGESPLPENAAVTLPVVVVLKANPNEVKVGTF